MQSVLPKNERLSKESIRATFLENFFVEDETDWFIKHLENEAHPWDSVGMEIRQQEARLSSKRTTNSARRARLAQTEELATPFDAVPGDDVEMLYNVFFASQNDDRLRIHGDLWSALEPDVRRSILKIHFALRKQGQESGNSNQRQERASYRPDQKRPASNAILKPSDNTALIPTPPAKDGASALVPTKQYGSTPTNANKATTVNAVSTTEEPDSDEDAITASEALFDLYANLAKQSQPFRHAYMTRTQVIDCQENVPVIRAHLE
jgi:hypothetical protein